MTLMCFFTAAAMRLGDTVELQHSKAVLEDYWCIRKLGSCNSKLPASGGDKRCTKGRGKKQGGQHRCCTCDTASEPLSSPPVSYICAFLQSYSYLFLLCTVKIFKERIAHRTCQSSVGKESSQGGSESSSQGESESDCDSEGSIEDFIVKDSEILTADEIK